MKFTETSILTIYTEAALETRLTDDFESFNVPGYTITNARGKGSRGARTAAWQADSNIRIEIICEDSLANELAEYLRAHYYDNFAMVVSISEVKVMRPEKFER